MASYARRAHRRFRDKNECHYCLRATLTNVDEQAPNRRTFDHVIPRAQGGPDATWNLVVCCRECNIEKRNEWPTCDCDFCYTARLLYIARYRVEWTDKYLEGIEMILGLRKRKPFTPPLTLHEIAVEIKRREP